MNNKILFFSLIIFLIFFINADSAYKSKKFLIGDIKVDELFNEYPIFKSRYENYKVTQQIDLRESTDLSVIITFGTWCHDSKREVPRMLKILDSAGMKSEQISLIGVDINKTEPNGREQLYNLKNTPTFILLRNGTEVGRIVERPQISLESDLINLTKSLAPVAED